MSQFRIAWAWFRRQIAWSNSRRSWYERLGVLALVGGGAGGWWISRDWSVAGRAALLAVWITLLAVIVRRGAIRLLGPVFFFELLRGSRKRIHLTRTLYALLLLAIVSYVYLIRTEAWHNYSDRSDLQTQSDTAFTIFVVFFAIQMVAVAMLTPVMIAGAIAEDKERRTLEFILATDLRSREIVLGKLAGRMANMLMFLIAGLPILSLLQVLGGIDPDLLLVSLVITVLTFFSVATVSVWQSTMLRRGRDAIVMTFLTIIGYVALSLVLFGTSQVFASDFGTSISLFSYSVSGADVVDVVGSGNPLIHVATIAKSMNFGSGGTMYDLIPGILRSYALFHVSVTVVGLIWSVLRLRPVALSQGSSSGTRRAKRGRLLPAIGQFPMHWKELFVDPGMRLHWLMRLPIYLIFLLSFLPPVRITVEYWDDLSEATQMSSMQVQSYRRFSDPWEPYSEAMNVWVRISSALVGTLLLLAVAARAAGSITGERSRQTFDELLASPLTNSEIVSGKWFGSLFGLRRAWLWLALIYFVGLATGGLNVLGLFLALGTWFCFAAFMASLGLWFSANSRSTLKAGLGTILTALFIVGGHWILTGLFCYLPLAQVMSHSDSRDLVEWTTAIQLGVTPPVIMGFAPVRDLKEFDVVRHDSLKYVVCMVLGTLAFLPAAMMLKAATVKRLAIVTGRTRLRHPERKAPLAKPIPQPEAEPIAAVLPIE